MENGKSISNEYPIFVGNKEKEYTIHYLYILNLYFLKTFFFNIINNSSRNNKANSKIQTKCNT